MKAPVLFFRLPLLLLGTLSFFLLPLSAQDFTWSSGSDGAWNEPANWTPDTDFPDDVSLDVLLPGGATGNITLDQVVTIGSLTRSDSGGNVNGITGTGSIILDNGANPSAFTYSGGTDMIEVPIEIASSVLNFEIPSGTTLSGGGLHASEGNDVTVHLETNGGILTISTNNDFNSGSLNLTDGSRIQLTSNAGGAGGADATVYFAGNNELRFSLLLDGNGVDVNYGSNLVFEGDTTAGGSGGNSARHHIATFGDVTLEEDVTVILTKLSGGNTTAIIGVDGVFTTTPGSVFFLQNSSDNNNNRSNLIIHDGGLLQGHGTIYGTDASFARIDVQSGATVRPGTETETGILRVGGMVDDTLEAGRLQLLNGSMASFRLNGTTPGSGHDQLFVNGRLDINNVTLDLELNTFFSPSDLVFIVRYDWVGDQTTTFFNDLEQGAMIEFLEGPYIGTASISYFGNASTNSITGGTDIVLYNFAVIPEPATVAAILGALALGLALWRRRKRA